MNSKLITALRTAANALEQNTFHYDWRTPESCNCGVVFCALTGKSSEDFCESIPTGDDIGATWMEKVGKLCPVTGIPTQPLFKELFGYGLTQIDIVNLENLSDARVLVRMNIGTVSVEVPTPRKLFAFRRRFSAAKVIEVPVKVQYDNKQHLIAYLRAWANLLAEDGKLDNVSSVETVFSQYEQGIKA